ncbi:MAG: acyl-CoA desaturase, partial [Flavobacteriaceae bacterium]
MQIAKGAIRFSRKDRQQFFSTLNKRVNAYFKENNLRKTGNWRLHLKTVILLTFFITPYVLLLS